YHATASTRLHALSLHDALPIFLRRHLPARLADTLLAEGDVHDDQSLATLRREQRRVLVTLLAEYPLPWTGDEGYRKAEVTGGGRSEEHTSELQSRENLVCRLLL